MLESKLFILPKLEDNPVTRSHWIALLDDWQDLILDRGASISELEREIIETIVHGTFDFGNYSGDVYEYVSELTVDGSVDGELTDGIMLNLFDGVDISHTDNPSRSLGCELAELVRVGRIKYFRHLNSVKFVRLGNDLAIRVIKEIKADRPSENADWFVTVQIETCDTGLLISPTIDEFRTLMHYWQSKYGHLVGHAASEEAIEYCATYIGRNVNKFDHLTIPDVPMGNPYSSLARSVVRYDTFDERGIEVLEVKDKLTACMAYYLKVIRDLLAAGCEDDEYCNRLHWTRFYNLMDRPVACHCGNFTNRKAVSRFCHGLVIHAFAEIFYDPTSQVSH